jgi:hypothetical protein
MELNNNTPIETYICSKSYGVDVKRDDLLNGDDTTLPPWAKIEPIRRIMLDSTTERPISCLSVRGSYSGWCLSRLGREYGYDIKVGFPNSKNFPKDELNKIESYGAELIPIKPNMVSIVYNKHKSISKERGWNIFPYGFDTPIYHSYFEDRIKEVEQEYDNLIVSAGSGVSSVGLIKGFMGKNKSVHIITASTTRTIERILNKYQISTENIFIHNTPYAFYDDVDIDTPFPCNSLWDKKAWWWIQNNRLKGKSLFWNLGG